MVERDNRLDSVKGILILFVVWGHIIGSCGTGMVNDHIWKFIYLFHMPLFILISGYFTSLKNDTNAFWRSQCKIILPLVFFQVICVLLMAILFHSRFGFDIIITPYWTLWYLLSLLYWRVMIQYSPRFLTDRPFIYLTISVIIAIVAGLMPYGRVLSIQRTLSFYPFFLFGFYLRKGILRTNFWPNYVSIFIVLLSLVLIFGGFIPQAIGQTVNLMLRGADQINMVDIPLKIVLFVGSFIMSISVFNIIPSNKHLSYLGRNSLFYYLFHGLVIKIVLVPIINSLQLPQGALIMVFYLFIVIGLIFLLEKLKPLRWLVYPLT